MTTRPLREPAESDIGRLLLKLKRRVYRSARRRSLAWLADYDPRLPGCWEEFRRISGQDFAFHPERGRFILETLEQYRPRIVLELGSGTSTAWFAAYAHKHGARIISFDQHEAWLNAAVQAAAPIAPVEAVVAPMVIEPGLGVRYSVALPDAEFIYLDGPSVMGAITGMAGKAVHLDVPRALAAGKRPAIVMVDSRVATVDHLREQGLMGDYRFLPEFKYSWSKRHWMQALSFRRQSVLIRRDLRRAA